MELRVWNSSLNAASLAIPSFHDWSAGQFVQCSQLDRNLGNILVDTGAATSVAPQSFAQHLELSPAPPTLKLTTATGKAVKIFGLRHVHLQCQDLILRVSFVIADVVTPLLGMDMIFQHNLSLIFEHGQSFLVNKAGKRTELQPKGEHLYLVACPFQHGLSTCSRGSLPEPIGFLPEDKELHEQTVALQSSSSTDLVEDRSFPEPLHVHDKSSFVCLLCEEKAVVSGGELSHNSLHPLHQQQPQQLSSKEQPLHKHPRSSLHRSVELQEAKSQELTHVLSTACVYDLPDLAWKDPACVFTGHLLQGQLSAKKSGQKMTNKLAARHRTRSSKSQVDIGADSSTALHTVVSVGSPASFGGASLGASMELSLPSPLAKSELAYEESLKETEEAFANTSFLQLRPVPSLDLDQLELQPVVASLSSRQKSLQQTELEAAYSAKKSLTAFTEQLCFKAKYQLGQTKARELELSRAQLCRPESAETSLQLASSSLTLNSLSFMAQFQASLTRASLLRKSLWQLTLRASWLNIFEPESSTRASRITAAGKLQVAGDLRSPESIHYVPLPQTMQSYLAIDVHDMYMDLRNVVQTNLAGKGSDPAEAEELRYENVFPNLTTGSVDLVVKAETSYHPKRPANNGVKGEVGSIIMAVWATLPFSLWPGMGMNAYLHTLPTPLLASRVRVTLSRR